MRGDRGVGVVTASLALAGGALAAPAHAVDRRSSTAPRLTGVALSRHVVGAAGGVVRVRAHARNARVCTVAVRPRLRRTPPRKSCTGGRVRWTLHVPANPAATTVNYTVTVTARGAHHATVVRHRRLTQAVTARPPAIDSFRAGRPKVEYVGGRVHLVAEVRHTKRCRVVAAPSTATATPVAGCAGGRGTWWLTVPANPTTDPASYALRLTAIGSHGRRASTTITLPQAPQPPPCPGRTSAASPSTGAFFNDPTTGAASDQSRIVDAEINLVCAAQLPAGGHHTQVWMAQYIFTLDDVAQALVWAHRYQHAQVHLVLDGSNEYLFNPDGTHVSNPAYDDVVAQLPKGSLVVCGPNAGKTGRPAVPGDDDESSVFPAGTGCAGDNILHTKLLAVSAVGPDRQPAVFTASQNFGTSSVQSAFNNGLQIVGDQALYNLDASYVAKLGDNRQQADFGARFGSAVHDFGGAAVSNSFGPQNSPAVFPAPKQDTTTNDATTDRMAALLRTVACTTPGRYAGDHSGSPRTTIRIAMFLYRSRDAVTAALTSLADGGCDIKLVYSTIDPKVLTKLEAHGIVATQLNTSAYPLSNGSTGRVFVHDKYVLISGGLTTTTGVVRNQDLVVAGSPNFTEKALHHNDEAAISYTQTATRAAGSPAIFTAYAANWEAVAAAAAAAAG